jgi:hypothetical protein
MTTDRLHQLDKLYQSVSAALDGCRSRADSCCLIHPNENKILVGATITL